MSRTAHDDVARTYRSGSSDPIRFQDGPGTWVETTIAAPLEAVWALVNDIELPARFSDEFLGARWHDDERGKGAWFTGRNHHAAVGEWELDSVVDAYEEGRLFGWATVDPESPGARWRYRLDAVEAGTRLRYEVTLGPGPSGTTAAIESMPDKEDRIIYRRISELHANMARTVGGIREIAEREATANQ